MKPIVIIGTGLAGYTLAREIRRLDPEMPLLMVTAEDGRYYSKPMLSSGLAQGKDADALALSGAGEMSASLDATILTETRVDRINPDRHTILIQGEIVEYRSLVLAVGADPIRLPLQGDGAPEVISVNNLTDYGRYRAHLESATRVAIIGPGLIGCEFANDLLSVDKKVTVIGPDPYPISTLLPEAVGKALQSALGEAGIGWHLGTVTASIDKSDYGYRVMLENGQQVAADLVLSAVGLRPHTQLAAEAGLEVNRGVVTDAYLATSAPDIYALGDCAEVEGRNLPFVAPLMTGAKALAKTLTGEPSAVVYPVMPVVIKTTRYPIVVVPPAASDAEWDVERVEKGIKALCRSADGALVGFALGGIAADEKQALINEMMSSE
jgi:rubredoxin-NAD+ reductase